MTPDGALGSFRSAWTYPTPSKSDMYGFLLTILVLDGVFLGVVILLQAGKGGGLAAMGGGAAATDVLGGRQATTLLTRATWIAGSVFMVLSLVLAIQSSRSTVPTSVLEGIANPATTAPQPVLPAATPSLELIPPAEAAEEPDEAGPAGESAPPESDQPPNPPGD